MNKQRKSTWSFLPRNLRFGKAIGFALNLGFAALSKRLVRRLDNPTRRNWRDKKYKKLVDEFLNVFQRTDRVWEKEEISDVANGKKRLLKRRSIIQDPIWLRTMQGSLSLWLLHIGEYYRSPCTRQVFALLMKSWRMERPTFTFIYCTTCQVTSSNVSFLISIGPKLFIDCQDHKPIVINKLGWN